MATIIYLYRCIFNDLPPQACYSSQEELSVDYREVWPINNHLLMQPIPFWLPIFGIRQGRMERESLKHREARSSRHNHDTTDNCKSQEDFDFLDNHESQDRQQEVARDQTRNELRGPPNEPHHGPLDRLGGKGGKRLPTCSKCH
ncbi:hypothetical protein BDP67DRAFT_245206 [Colletotrichum lupini]|nr:hypothetical protein BDP67DRAFT_245206 [Colletotrichum lupini]